MKVIDLNTGISLEQDLNIISYLRVKERLPFSNRNSAIFKPKSIIKRVLKLRLFSYELRWWM